MNYSGIGSRETPDVILEMMQAIAYKLAGRGYTLRSGGTATAIKLAEKYGVPYFNLYKEGDRLRLEAFIKG